MDQLNKILITLNEGEWFVIPVLLLLFLFFKRKTLIYSELLVSYNYLKLFLIALYLTIIIFQLTNIYLQTGNNGEFATFEYRISGPYSWSYRIPVLISFVLFIFLCFKRWRLNPWFAFVIFFLGYFNLWMERLIIFISSLYRDFIPSSWSVYYSFLQPLVSIGIFSTVLFLIYFLRKRKDVTKAER